MIIEELVQDTIRELEKEFYSKDFRFSYSSLKTLLFSPVAFYNAYVVKQRDEKTSSNLVEGKIIHCLLLDKSVFNDNFVISPFKLPTAQVKTLLDKLYSRNKLLLRNNNLTLTDFKDNILALLIEMQYHQTLKIDEDRIKKIITDENESYFQFLIAKDKKDVVDYETLKYCNDSVNIVRSYPDIVELLGLDDDELNNSEVYNELYMEAELPAFPFALKGIIDNLKIDHTNKTITINDFKTSGKGLKDFKDSVEFYSYWMQAAVYLVMVIQKYSELIKQGYTYHFNFIVIDKYLNVYAFPVTYKTQIDWLKRLDESLEIARYHYDTKRFELPYEFDIKAVKL